MGKIVRQVMASSLSEARAAAGAYQVGREMYGDKITKVVVQLAKTGRRPYDIIITTAEVKKRR